LSRLKRHLVRNCLSKMKRRKNELLKRKLRKNKGSGKKKNEKSKKRKKRRKRKRPKRLQKLQKNQPLWVKSTRI